MNVPTDQITSDRLRKKKTENKIEQFKKLLNFYKGKKKKKKN